MMNIDVSRMKVEKLLVFVPVLIAYLLGCEKSPGENPCDSAVPAKAEFYIKENLSDTAFLADTIFRDNVVTFEANSSYYATTWKVGEDPRVFTARSFTLSFADFLGSLDVQFTGRATPNTRCFPLDSGVYSGTKKLTVVEQEQKPFVTVSPMVGRYKGAYREAPQDSFIVRIEYFDSSKYDASVTGSKNFYWISNIPKGYVDTTSSPAFLYPELRKGMRSEMGYKCLQFGELGNVLSGRGFATLRNDSLIVYYNHVLTGRKTFMGKRM